ncbi:LOW QUALITY PROTEIN: hypothetical protein PNEG_04254 [Pneumocystis murina B123]|uniref:Uncharacterized protein n=1 Tax=Pneumocystis murina (strain B123) TaxID=1069680 RepID=A0A0W4ZX48_PNEMU|nr:LOW QUALITY PROTEIN: hypothetical protein PNEG_04254 [Pneumocystis murina B123]KTW32948.1 LOW QUALITY PROTEIN: hypothetical protein PNEG_04254 [Pneumocystis murina B123]
MKCIIYFEEKDVFADSKITVGEFFISDLLDIKHFTEDKKTIGFVHNREASLKRTFFSFARILIYIFLESMIESTLYFVIVVLNWVVLFAIIL